MLLFLLLLMWMHGDAKRHAEEMFQKSLQSQPLLNEKVTSLRSPRCFFTDCPSYSTCEYRWGNAQRCESFRGKYAVYEEEQSHKLLQMQIEEIVTLRRKEVRKVCVPKKHIKAIKAPGKEDFLREEYESIRDQIEVYS